MLLAAVDLVKSCKCSSFNKYIFSQEGKPLTYLSLIPVQKLEELWLPGCNWSFLDRGQSISPSGYRISSNVPENLGKI